MVRPATARGCIRKRSRPRAHQVRTVTDSAHIGVGEDLVLAPVDQLSDLVDVGWGETVGIGLVVGQLSVDVIVDIPLFGNRNQITNSEAAVTEGKLTMFSKVVGRPKV